MTNNDGPSVAMMDIRKNITEKLVFMDFEINGRRYPEQDKTENKFLKILNPNPFENGYIVLEENLVKVFDENKVEITSFTTDQIRKIELGAYRAIVRSAPLVTPNTRFVVTFNIFVSDSVYHVINDDLSVLKPFIDALDIEPQKVVDTMKIVENFAFFINMDNDLFERLSKGTKYFAPLQQIGSNVRW